MTSANDTGAWVRDYAADENPDLMRKRPRTGEDPHTSPAPSSDGSVVVEAVESAPLGTSIDNSIQIYDDPSMDLYSESFALWNVDLDAARQLERLARRLSNNQAIEPQCFLALANWIHTHLNVTAGSATEWQAGYLRDQVFFAHFGEVMFLLLTRPEPIIDPRIPVAVLDGLRRAVEVLYTALTGLSIRILRCLPHMVDSTLSRRDSANPSVPRHRIHLFWYVHILAVLLTSRRASAEICFKEHLALKPEIFMRPCRDMFRQEPLARASLLDLFQRLGRAHSDIESSWETIDAILWLMKRSDLGIKQELEAALDITQIHLLPVVCQKHPRALPEAFLETLVDTTSRGMSTVIAATDVEVASQLYRRFVESDDDALLSGPASAASVAVALSNLADGDQGLLATLMSTAWNLQTLQKLISSDIMDIRTQGMSLLSAKLARLWELYRVAQLKAEHPVLQYVARFMRVTELTQYIFGPNSHAALVHHSHHIFGFLAVSGALTELELDIIWHACTTNVEAEFVHASFNILRFLYPWLGMEYLRYLADKYMSTPPPKLGRDGIDSLYPLLSRMYELAGDTLDPLDRLACPLTCVGILKRTTNSPEDPYSKSLSVITRDGLVEFAQSRSQVEDRIHIYTTCIADIKDRTEHATTSVDILLLFLQRRQSDLETEWLTSNLSTDCLSEELAHFIDDLPLRPESPTSFVLDAIKLRIEAFIHLLAIGNTSQFIAKDTVLSSFYRYIIGEKAIHNEARQYAWAVLTHLTSVTPIEAITTQVLQYFVEDKAMSLPAEHVTPQLVELWGLQLMNGSQYHEAQPEDTTDFLSSPLWQRLVDIAEGSMIIPSHRLAIKKICLILFDSPLQRSPLGNPSTYDAEFMHQQIDRLHSHYQAYLRSKHDEDLVKIVRSIDIMDAVLLRSRNSADVEQDHHLPTLNLVGETLDTTSSYALRIHGIAGPPREFELQVSTSTTVDDLATQLRGLTGAVKNRIIMAGKSVDLDAEAGMPLVAVAKANPGVILVSPKYTFTSDLRKILAAPGRVEQQVLQQFERLELLLAGPDQVGEKMFQFLIKFSPPLAARARLTVTNVTAHDLFPPSHIWQSMYYIFVLKNQLVEFYRIGVIDKEFLIRGVRLLATVLTHGEWPTRIPFLVRVLHCMTVFLEEHTENHLTEPLIEDSARFTSCVVDLCFHTSEVTTNLSPARIQLIDHAVRCLFLLCRKQNSVWTSLAQHERFFEFNKRLLLSHEPVISKNTALAVRKLCLDLETATGIVDLYMDTLVAILPDALECGHLSFAYLGVATDVVLANRALLVDEARTRALVDNLISRLWSYSHSESVDLPLDDPAVLGLLRLLTGALNVLRSFKKPLNLQGFSPSLLRRFLFPPLGDMRSRPLVDPQTRHLAYGLVLTTWESTDDLVELLDGVLTPLSGVAQEPSAVYPGRQDWLRPAWRCSGLTNLGMTCYMNSLLQQLFSNIQFRKFTFETAVINPVEQSFLVEVQKLFSHMQDEYNCVADTKALAQNLETHLESQEDVHGFYADFLSRLELNMPDDASKSSLSRFFTGKLISQIKGECGHVSPRAEPFVDLPIIVKNKASLQDSLDEFVQGEPMEGTNKYRCQACDPDGGGRLVNAMRRTCIEELPENVTFCLKRFAYETGNPLDGKVNDRFEFPETIDLSRYLRVHLEDPSAEVAADVFELVGVIVHQGTPMIGHYWSYALLRNSGATDDRVWVKLEDGNVSPVDGIAEVQRECVGGQIFSNGHPRTDNAYVLFYQRKSILDGHSLGSADISRDLSAYGRLPPRVEIPDHLSRQIHQANDWRQRIAQLFDEDFAATVEWLLKMLRPHISVSSPSSASDDTRSDDDSSKASVESDQVPSGELINKVSDLGMTYLLRVAACDTKAYERIQPVLNELGVTLAQQPKIMYKLLDRFFQDWVSLLGIMSHTNESVRSQILAFVLQCLKMLRGQGGCNYRELRERIPLALHQIRDSIADLGRINWNSFFGFVARFAQAGAEETKFVLDLDFLRWSFHMLHLLCNQAAAQKNPKLFELVHNEPSRVSALYNFIADVLASHVDPASITEPLDLHVVGDRGVSLSMTELSYLTEHAQDGVLSWIWLAKYAETTRNWREFAPGRLMRFLMQTKSLDNVQRVIDISLSRHNEREEHNLNALLQLTLRFCAECRREGDATMAFSALTRTFCEWDGMLDMLGFMHEAYSIAPCVVVVHIHVWCMHFLTHKSRKIQQATEKCLHEAIFRHNPVSDEPMLDACRVHEVRTLVQMVCDAVQSAYQEEKPRAKYETLISVMNSAASYLRFLQTTVENYLKNPDDEVRGRLSNEVRIQCDESKVCLAMVERLLDDMTDWISDETMLSSPLEQARPSVETVSEDAESSEDEEWDDDTEQG